MVLIDNICIRSIWVNIYEKSLSEHINISHLRNKPCGDEALSEIQHSNKKLEVMEVSVHNIFDVSPESIGNTQSTLCLKSQGVEYEDKGCHESL